MGQQDEHNNKFNGIYEQLNKMKGAHRECEETTRVNGHVHTESREGPKTLTLCWGTRRHADKELYIGLTMLHRCQHIIGGKEGVPY